MFFVGSVVFLALSERSPHYNSPLLKISMQYLLTDPICCLSHTFPQYHTLSSHCYFKDCFTCVPLLCQLWEQHSFHSSLCHQLKPICLLPSSYKWCVLKGKESLFVFLSMVRKPSSFATWCCHNIWELYWHLLYFAFCSPFLIRRVWLFCVLHRDKSSLSPKLSES